jgi:fructose-1,6-bisphosphatase/inositol monophosphatase family enzyme
MVDPIMNVWDCAPFLPILTEAGGRFTSREGEATIHGGSAVASNGALHDEVLRILVTG